jgi:CubicO group peptidase (beta-lactamase class C family)
MMSKTKIIFISLLFLLVINTSAQDLTSKFDEYFDSLAKGGRFTGAALVARDGKVIFSKGYGMANLEFDIPNTPQTKFRLGSITKQFTAVSLLLLQERGKLNVQDPVCKYVDNCPAAWNEVTIHHLLTHTGGMPSFTGFPDYRKTMMIPTTMDGLIARFKDKPLEFKPGEKWIYSNSGYVLLGHIIEKVAGESYEGFIRKNIFDPLKMNDTGYDTHDKILKNRATGYSFQNGKIANSLPIDMTIPHAAGALYSTVEDMFKWNEALFSDKLLSAKSREVMMTPVLQNYGYGIAIETKFNRKMISHGGGINGFSTMLSRFPEEKLTVVVLRNADYGIPNPGRIAQDLAAIALGEKYEIPRERVVAKVDPKVFDAYVGQYELMPNFIMTITREGDHLMSQPTGQGKLELFPESETKYFLKMVDAQVTFVKDEQGQVTHLILHQGGDRQAKKIK